MKEKDENPEEIKENEIKNLNKEENINIDTNQTDKQYIICHDKTIIEVSDKKWSRYLISYKTILETKLQLSKDKLSNKYNPNDKITLLNINEKQCTLLSNIIDELNENNLTYHWLQVPDVNNKLIVIKKEHLLKQKIKDEEVEILDYNSKKYKINPGKVCRLAKKYHITKGPGEDNILYLIKDISNQPHFVTKTIIQFAKKKRALNYENQTMEITEYNNQIIKVNCDSIRDLEDFNPYSEWVEINDINNNKIIVKKVNLSDCKELFDKNIEGGNEIQKINDWKYDVYEININNEYSKVFPNRYKYFNDINKYDEYSKVEDINKNKIHIKTSLIEYYLDENINELSLYEEVFDKDNQRQIINPNQIIKSILLNYDDICDINGPYVEIMTQSGSKHIIKVRTINKILKLAENNKDNNDKVSINDNSGIKILTSLKKIKEINLNNNNIILLGFKDIEENMCYFKKKDIINKINEILLNLIEEDYLILNDINGLQRTIKYSQIRIINNRLKKNSNLKN